MDQLIQRHGSTGKKHERPSKMGSNQIHVGRECHFWACVFEVLA